MIFLVIVLTLIIIFYTFCTLALISFLIDRIDVIMKLMREEDNKISEYVCHSETKEEKENAKSNCKNSHN